MASTSGGEFNKLNLSGMPKPRNNKPKRRSSDDDTHQQGKKKVLYTSTDGTTYIAGATVPLQNAYESLSSDDDMDTEEPLKQTHKLARPKGQNSPASVKKSRIPPIVVQNSSKADIIKLMKTKTIENFHTKTTSVGIYLYTVSVEDHKKARQALSEGNVHHFTHDLPEDKQFKIVVTRLEESSPEELKAALVAKGIHPLDVKQLVPKNPRYPGHMNYIVYFKKGAVKINDLRKHTLICHSSVKYEVYRPIKNNVTQCRICLMPGHGTRNCNRPAKCMHCAGDHLSEECTPFKDAREAALAEHTKQGKDKNEPIELNFTFKCVNCNMAFRGDHKDCPKKKEYADLQKNLSSRNRRGPPKKQQYQYEVRSSQPRGVALNRPFIGGGSFSNALKNGIGREYSNALPPNPTFNKSDTSHPTSNDDLFSADEINCILLDMFTHLKACKSKQDQLNVLFKLSIKYLYDGTN